MAEAKTNSRNWQYCLAKTSLVTLLIMGAY